MKTLISRAVVATILAGAALSSANADTPADGGAPGAKSHHQTLGHSSHRGQPNKVQPVGKTQNIVNQNSKRALNPQPVPPGSKHALNPQPLPPG
jgi:hypothetical protein